MAEDRINLKDFNFPESAENMDNIQWLNAIGDQLDRIIGPPKFRRREPEKSEEFQAMFNKPGL